MLNHFICVSGNCGSGKSTLTTMISKNFSLAKVPKQGTHVDYKFINKFHSEREKYFLPTQLAFLSSKVHQIMELLENKENIVLDRSLFEDVFVFAKYWIDTLNLEKDISNIYLELSRYLINSIPKPTLIIFCKASPIICSNRIKKREKRLYEKNYSNDFLTALDEYLAKWFTQIDDIPKVIIDTEKYDLTIAKNKKQLISELHYLLNRENDNVAYRQISLFDDLNSLSKFNYKIIEGIHFPENFKSSLSKIERVKNKKFRIYIAAPFTSFATVENKENRFDNTDEYGVVEDEYKNILLSIEKRFSNLGFETILPHRDVNKWGKAPLKSEEVVNEILRHVESSDIVISIPSNSIGVHLELGIAMAKKIPVIICNITEEERIKSSFFCKGFSSYEKAMVINSKTLDELVAILRKQDLNLFLRKNGLI